MASSLIVGGLAAAGTVGAAALSSGGGGSTGLGMSSGEKKMANRAQFQKEMGAVKSDLENQLFKEQLMASEKFRMGAFNLLGAPGTYEDNYEDFYAGLEGTGPSGVAAPTGMFSLVERTERLQTPAHLLMNKGIGIYSKQERKQAKRYKKTKGLKGKDFDPERDTARAEAWILNPDAALQHLAKSRQFRMVSKMTAEADQLVRQEGPMWEKLKQSVQNPILQGAAAANEQVMESLARDAARSGSARNRAVQTARQIQAQSDIMRDRANALWQSNLALKQWTVDNARAQLAFNQSWTSNLGGIRDRYSGFMQNAQQFYGSQILPSVVDAQNSTQRSADNAYNTRSNAESDLRQMQAKRDSELGGIISGATEVIGGSILTGMSQGGGTRTPTGSFSTNTSSNFAVANIPTF